MPLIRIATRNSPLALWQADYVQKRLLQAHTDLHVEIVSMTTKGDQMLDRSLSKVGGKGLFLKELEVSLLEKKTDIAVHSMKDVPVELPEGLEINTVCEREDARDAFVSNRYSSFDKLHDGAIVGTSSLRRISQLQHKYPSLKFVELRGNVNTRLRKLDDGEYDAIILAAAGLIRLGMVERISDYLDTDISLPAVGQGIVGIECRSDDEQTKQYLSVLHDATSAACLAAERAMNATLQGGCQVPIAGYAQLQDGQLHLRGMVGSVDGTQRLLSDAQCNCDLKSIDVGAITAIGVSVGQSLLDQGADKILQEVYAQAQQEDEPIVTVDDNQVQHKAVLLTRQKQFLANSQTLFQNLGYVPVHIPTMSVSSIEDDTRLKHIFANIAEYTDIVFVSRNAVDYGVRYLNAVGGILPHTNVYAVGKNTARQLFSHSIDASFPSKDTGAQALMQAPELASMDGRKVLIIRGNEGSDWLRDAMQSRGAQVDYAQCYSVAMPKQSAAQLRKLLEQSKVPTQSGGKVAGSVKQELVAVFLHSSYSAQNFIKMLGEHLDALTSIIAVVGSQNIDQTLQEAQWPGRVQVAKSPSNHDMMIALAQIENT